MKLSIKTTKGKRYIFHQYPKEVEVDNEYGEEVVVFTIKELKVLAVKLVWELYSRDELLDLAHQFIFYVFYKRSALDIFSWRNEQLDKGEK